MTKTFCKFVVLLTVSLAGSLGLFSQDMRPLAASLAPRITASGRKTVAVVDFTDLEGNPTKLGRFLAEEFSIALLQDAKGFEVVDRTHINTLLQEHKLASSGLIDPATARKLGQIAGVDALVTGTITPFEEHIRLSLKVLDTETAKMLAADTADIPKTKTLADIQGAEVSPHPSKSPAAEDKPRASPTAKLPVYAPRDLTFEIEECTRNSPSLIKCWGYATNTGENLEELTFYDSVAVDDLGNTIYGGFSFTDGYSQKLMPKVRTRFRVALEDKHVDVQKLNFQLNMAWAGERQTVVFNDVPVQR